MSKFVNKAADGGITALHMAALNGYFDCVQLLLDLHANVSAVTFHYGTSMDLIGMPFISGPTTCFIGGRHIATDKKVNILILLCRSWKHPFALCCLRGKFEMLSGKFLFKSMSSHAYNPHLV